jgi:Tfp pilus assembly protein PilX
MTLVQKIRHQVRGNISPNEKGVVLIAVLVLLTTLILVGTTAFIVSSTDVKVGGNYKMNQTALQVAMAGAEKAREALRAANAASTNTSNFSEELAARVGANGLLNGYTSTTDDSPIATSSSLVSGYTYNAYLTNDSSEGASSTTDSNGKVVITSVATGPNNSKAMVITTVQLYSFSNNSPAALYSKDNTTLNGSSINISGNDAGSCGGSTLSAVYVYSDPSTNNTHTLTQNGNPTLTGSPATQTGTNNIDLQSYVDTLKGSATVTLTQDVSASGNGTTSYGSTTNYVTVYSDATQQADGELRLNNVTGYGILLVKGNLQLAGNIDWHGIIIATGVITASGGGSNSKNIQGQIYSGSSSLGDTTVSGSVTISYNSCDVKKSLSSQPLKVVNWKQSY